MAQVIWRTPQAKNLEVFSSLCAMEISDIRPTLKATGRKQKDLAAHLGLDPSSMTKLLDGNRGVKAEEMQKIEAFFAAVPAEVQTLAERRGKPQRRIPVYGYAMAGAADAVAFNSGQIIDWIDAPPLWSGAGDLIGIRVTGDSMEPRLFAGELVIAQVGLPPERERDCVIEFKSGAALVKTYRGRKDGKVLVEQWNPHRQLMFEATEIQEIHAVVWRR